MKFGAIFPTCEIGNDPVVIRDWAQAAEELGYSHIIAYDHVLGGVREDRDPPMMSAYDNHNPFHEPFTLFAYLAGLTSTIDFVTGVLVVPQRQTVLVAKQAAELSVLSNGRLRLGLGTGNNYVEYDGLSASFKDRGRVLDEQVEVLRKLWTEPVVDFSGDFHRIDRAGISPQPVSSIPIWFGGRSRPAIRRAAACGDGFLFSPASDPIKDLCQQLIADLEANGKREGFGIDVFTGFGDGPKHWQREIKAWEGLGADSISMRTMSTSSMMFGEKDPGFTTPQQHIDALATFMREVR
ncbi:MAG TPA: LLM class F420-dependent oxidoreductase [Myxococcales bacterium]|nr:LLM class F420-dependent oxidoreductase [Myxococcales bacterium]